MLTIKTNKNNCKITYVPLNVNSIVTGETVYDDVTISTKDGHNLRENDEIEFIRNDGELISYFKDCEVKHVINKTSFTINGLGQYIIGVNGYDLIRVIKPNTIDSGEETMYARLNTNSHIFTINRDNIDPRRRYYWSEEEIKYIYDGALTECIGDYYQYDNMFLVENLGNGNIEIKNITGLTITAVTSSYDEPFILQNCLIGVNNDGSDDTSHVYIPQEYNQEFISQLEDIFPVTVFMADDIRFLYNGENQMKFGVILQPGTQVDKKCGNIEIDFNIGNSFESNLYHNEQINNFIDKVKKESINKIIDYERHQYTPMYYSGRIPITESSTDEYLMKNYEIDENLKEVTEIRFQLNFRDKFYTLYNAKGDVIPEGSEDVVDSVDFGTWQTDDSKYWNNYTLSSDQKHLDYVYRSYNVYGDLLGYLGFTDDDVYYQKDALKKSFLRLSFYDSPNRETQKLLYYSTVYFDTNVLSSNYIKDLNEWRNDVTYAPRYNQLVFAYDIARRYKNGKTLTAEMSCTDKYDDTKSSDGFYIHLFDKLVSGNTCRAIYMKAEFNNAKFGKTVPMIMPVFKNSNERIPPVNTKFPREYVKKKTNETGDTYTYADIESLMRDMYIKIFIKYDFKTNQYVWFLPKHQDEDVIKLELFEPRVKGYDLASYNELNGDEVGYGTIDGTPNWFQGKFIKEDDKYVWFLEEGGNKYSEFGSEYTERLPELDNYTCLMTTATTLQGENMLNGTKLFNSKNINKIASIWIDGMMIYDESHYSGGVYTTDRLQLPDIPFEAICLDDDEYKSFTWKPDETTEVWNDKDEIWEDTAKNPKKIHRVNYYFRNNKKNQENLINELYLGVKGRKKTIETTREICNLISNGLSLSDAETIPSGLFSKIESLRCVRIINDEKHFSAIGNGCFNCCKSLVRLEIQEGVINIIGKNAFSGCASLKEAKLSDTKIILKEAFQGCYTLTVLEFKTDGDSTRYIGCGSFGNTKIRNITLPNSIVRIGNSAFRRCFQLGWIAIKNGSSSCLIGGFGKRVFSDSARYKYNLSPLVDKKDSGFYYYYGGIPNIIKDSIRYNYKVKFYDAFRQKQVTLSIIDNKDRGKLNKQFKDKEYRTYLNKTKNRVYCFSKWLRYIFGK